MPTRVRCRLERALLHRRHQSRELVERSLGICGWPLESNGEPRSGVASAGCARKRVRHVMQVVGLRLLHGQRLLRCSAFFSHEPAEHKSPIWSSQPRSSEESMCRADATTDLFEASGGPRGSDTSSGSRGCPGVCDGSGPGVCSRVCPAPAGGVCGVAGGVGDCGSGPSVFGAFPQPQ